MMGKVMMSGVAPQMTCPLTGIKASELAVGSSVYLMEDGIAVEYLVVNQGKPSGSSLYDDSCDGMWLLRKELKENRQWHSSNVNDYQNSIINSWLNGDFFNQLGTVEQASIKQVKIPYRAGSGTSKTITYGESGLYTNAFLLSAKEVNLIFDDVPTNEGACLSYFSGTLQVGNETKRVAYLNGSNKGWWLRSPNCNTSNGSALALGINSAGNQGGTTCSDALGIRPALILPSTSVFDETTMLLKGVS